MRFYIRATFDGQKCTGLTTLLVLPIILLSLDTFVDYCALALGTF